MKNTFQEIGDLPPEIANARYYPRFSFAGFGVESSCTILLVRKKSRGLVVVCSQIPGAIGTSVTNGLEAIGARLDKEFPPSWEKQIPLWFEHYPTGTGMLENRYTLMKVTYDGGGPSWSPLCWRALNFDQACAANFDQGL